MSTGSETASASPAPGVTGARLDWVAGAGAAISGSTRASPAGALRNTGAGGRASRAPGVGRAGACRGRHWPSRVATPRRVHRRTAASRSGTPMMSASNKALASHQSGSGTGGGAFAAASAARCAASCACTSCCMRSTIAVSSTMRWRRMTVSASIEFASSCCARSRSASVRAPSATVASPTGAELDTVSRGRSAAAAGGRFGADFAGARALGGAALRAGPAPTPEPEAAAPRARAARRSPRCARGTTCGGRRLRRGHGLARRGFRGDDRGFDRGRVHEQRVFALHRCFAAGLYRDSDDGIVYRPRAGDDELRSGGRALDGEAAEQDLRDAVRVALCRRKLEAFRRNVLFGSEGYRNDDPQWNSESRLLRDRAEYNGGQRQRRERAQDACDGGGKPRHRVRPRGERRGAAGCAESAEGAGRGWSHGFGWRWRDGNAARPGNHPRSSCADRSLDYSFTRSAPFAPRTLPPDRPCSSSVSSPRMRSGTSCEPH